MHIKDIIKFLNTKSIPFQWVEASNKDADFSYRPASLKKAIPHGIYFLQDPPEGFETHLKDAVLLCPRPMGSGNHELIVSNPQLVHYLLMSMFVEKPTAQIHPTAVISEQAVIGKNVSIGPYAVIGKCIIGDDCILQKHVVIEDGVTIGNDCFIDSSTVIGAAGLAWIWDESGNRIMQPQMGGVVIEDHCMLGTDITIVRGSVSEDTIIGAGTIISHGSKIGHGCYIGKQVHFANNVSLAGNVRIGDNAFLGSACVISSNISVPEHSIVGAAALVNKNFEETYVTLAGVPAVIIKRNNFESKPKGAPQPFKKNKT